MNESLPLTATPERASLSSRFFSGFGSGAFSGVVMISILTGLTATAALLTGVPAIAAFLGTVAMPTAAHTLVLGGITALSTALFGGVMAVKRAMSEPSPAALRARDIAAMTLPALSPSLAPSLAAQPELADESAPTKNWAASVSRSPADRIQSILANGTLSDHDRASAILAERQASTGNNASLG